MDTAQQDFTYYHRSLIQMYQVYYRRRLYGIATAILIIIGYSLLFREGLIINGLLLILLLAIAGWLYKRFGEAEEVIAAHLSQNSPPKVRQLTEFEDVYGFDPGDGSVLYIKKRSNRNFPSQDKSLTLMAGYQKGYFLKQPFMILYYDMLETVLDEAYRLKRNRQNGYQRWSGFFNFRRIKSSIGNGFRLVFGNLILLFIAYRLVRYLIQMILYFF